MSTSKNERVLILISHMVKEGDTGYLYRFIETAGWGTVDTILGDDYAYIVKLYGANATLAKLITALKRQGAQASIKRIDLKSLRRGSHAQFTS